MSKAKSSQKSAIAKRKLIALSREAKDYRKKLIAAAKTDAEALAAAGLKINDILMMFHQNATGQTEFHTFKEWKEKGMSVKPGETSFRIWGKPRKGQKTIEREEGDNFEHNYSFYPMVCLFHIGQVEGLVDSTAS